MNTIDFPRVHEDNDGTYYIEFPDGSTSDCYHSKNRAVAEMQRPVGGWAKRLMRLHVARSTVGDCTNGGTSARNTTLHLFGADVTIDQIEPHLRDAAVRLNVRHLRRVVVVTVEPVAPVGPHSIGWMAGGNYASGDSRLSDEVERVAGINFYGALPVHDRCETPEQYRALSI